MRNLCISFQSLSSANHSADDGGELEVSEYFSPKKRRKHDSVKKVEKRFSSSSRIGLTNDWSKCGDGFGESSGNLGDEKSRKNVSTRKGVKGR